MSKFRNIIIGEPMPDKNDPKYRERYERDVAAGRKFADRVGITKSLNKMQVFGENHKKPFLYTVVLIVLLLFVINTSRFITSLRSDKTVRVTAVERVDSALNVSHTTKRIR